MGVNSLPWYHLAGLAEAGTTVSLAGDEWHHCYNVLRMGEGDGIILFDGAGLCREGFIKVATKNEGLIELTADLSESFTVAGPNRLIVAFAPTKNIDRTEFAVEKLVELGVDEICFLECDHSERNHLRLDRMEKIVLSAAKQSRKVYLPALRDLISPTMLITHFKREHPDIQVYCCHLDETSSALSENYLPGQDVLILVGPEGGFSVEECEQMVLRGGKLVTLGPYRLRVETAAVAACASIHILNELKKTS
jgi:16S rRNA (uracil1498-N3)-methyltransferase